MLIFFGEFFRKKLNFCLSIDTFASNDNVILSIPTVIGLSKKFDAIISYDFK